jgi:hypothetical protein
MSSIRPQGNGDAAPSDRDTAKNKEYVTEKHFERANVDTTIQEKAIAFSADAYLYHKARRILVRLVKRAGIDLRQSYERWAEELFSPLSLPLYSLGTFWVEDGHQSKAMPRYSRRAFLLPCRCRAGRSPVRSLCRSRRTAASPLWSDHSEDYRLPGS